MNDDRRVAGDKIAHGDTFGASGVDSREPLTGSGVQANGGTHTPSPGASPSDSWDEDERMRLAGFFVLLHDWDRRLEKPTPERKAA